MSSQSETTELILLAGSFCAGIPSGETLTPITAPAAVIDRPDLDLSGVPVSQRTDAGFGSADISGQKTLGGGNFR